MDQWFLKNKDKGEVRVDPLVFLARPVPMKPLWAVNSGELAVRTARAWIGRTLLKFPSLQGSRVSLIGV